MTWQFSEYSKIKQPTKTHGTQLSVQPQQLHTESAQHKEESPNAAPTTDSTQCAPVLPLSLQAVWPVWYEAYVITRCLHGHTPEGLTLDVSVARFFEDRRTNGAYRPLKSQSKSKHHEWQCAKPTAVPRTTLMGTLVTAQTIALSVNRVIIRVARCTF